MRISEVTNNLRTTERTWSWLDFNDYRHALHTVQELYKQKQT